MTEIWPPLALAAVVGRIGYNFVSVELGAIPYRLWRDSSNIVARVNLPNMRHERTERVEVFAAAMQGLIALEQDPEKRLKYTDFIDAYAALDEAEYARYQGLYPDEVEIMKSYPERVREEGMRHDDAKGDRCLSAGAFTLFRSVPYSAYLEYVASAAYAVSAPLQREHGRA